MNIHNLRQARNTKGMTQKAVADMLGIGQSTYKNYECGFREPNGDMIVALADMFGVTTDYLLGREPKPPEPNPFADLNLSEEDEAEVVAKYMSMPPEVRAIMLDVLLQLADAARNKPNENEKRSGTNAAEI